MIDNNVTTMQSIQSNNNNKKKKKKKENGNNNKGQAKLTYSNEIVTIVIEITSW